jgi:hypothetical protein
MQSSYSLNPGSTNSLIFAEKREDFSRKTYTNPKVYESFKFSQDSTPEPYRRAVKYVIYYNK